MRILLDECVPWPLRKILPKHDWATPQKQGWGGVKNGDLIRLAETAFDLFITSDQNIRYQQNLSNRVIPIIELSTNDLRRLLRAGEQISSAIERIKPGEFLSLEIAQEPA